MISFAALFIVSGSDALASPVQGNTPASSGALADLKHPVADNCTNTNDISKQYSVDEEGCYENQESRGSVWFIEGAVTDKLCFLTYDLPYCKRKKGKSDFCPIKGIDIKKYLEKSKPYDKLSDLDKEYKDEKGRCYGEDRVKRGRGRSYKVIMVSPNIVPYNSGCLDNPCIVALFN